MLFFRFNPLQAFLFLLIVGLCSPVQADKSREHDAQTDRLRGLNALEVLLLSPYLEQGPVALIEFANSKKDQLPAINLASIIHAPASAVMKTIAHPQTYPKFMSTIDHVNIVERFGSTTVYDWSWKLSLFKLRGRNSLTLYKPRSPSSKKGYRVTMKSTSGDLGKGRVSMRILPMSASKSLLVISVRLDMRSANYVVRQMAKASRSINRSVNILMSCSTLFALRDEVERKAGYRPEKQPHPELARPQIDTKKLLPLLARGDLVFFNMHGDTLNQISIVGRVLHNKGFLKELMADAHAFGSALIHGSYARVISESAKKIDFEWGIDLPLVDVEGQMQLREHRDMIAIDAISGALNGGRWRFDVSELTPKSSVVTGWTRFDMKNSTWLIEHLISVDPNISHGLSAAADVMLLRSLRSRAKKKAKRMMAQATKTAKAKDQKQLRN